MIETGDTKVAPLPVPTACVGVGIEVIDGPDRDLCCAAAGGELTIGTSTENDVVLTDSSVSQHHLWMRARDGVLVRDLGSRSGTFLGGMRIREAIVPVGARLRVGDTVLRIVEGAPRSDAETPPLVRNTGIIGVSAAMREVLRAIDRLSRCDVSVLVHGETGTGKELVSRALHDLGPRAGKPYIIVDVGALAPTLIASQLFGHERGAFTGADSRREGAFEQANGGSILLDEIGELPASVQPALLGVLERRKFRRLGGKEEIHVDVRVIAATHRDLRAEVQRGTFREDLYFRMAAARIHVPPLRDRPEDVEPLVSHFAKQMAGQDGIEATSSLMSALRFYPWPGNVRELRNVVEGALVTGSAAPEAAGAAVESRTQDTPRPDGVVPYRTAREAALGTFERAYLRCLMQSAGGNAAAAARLARMDRSYLMSLLRKLQIRGPAQPRTATPTAGAARAEARTPLPTAQVGLPKGAWPEPDIQHLRPPGRRD
jgi:DNA-binding NtrC family response regulator